MALSDGPRSKRHWWMLALSAVSLTLTAVFSTPSWRWASALIGLGLQFMYCVAEEATTLADPPAAGSGGHRRAAAPLSKGAADDQHTGGSGGGGGGGNPASFSSSSSSSCGSLPVRGDATADDERPKGDLAAGATSGPLAAMKAASAQAAAAAAQARSHAAAAAAAAAAEDAVGLLAAGGGGGGGGNSSSSSNNKALRTLGEKIVAAADHSRRKGSVQAADEGLLDEDTDAALWQASLRARSEGDMGNGRLRAATLMDHLLGGSDGGEFPMLVSHGDWGAVRLYVRYSLLAIY